MEIIIILICVVVIYFLWKSNQKLRKEFKDLKHKKQSQSAMYGQATEKFVPFMNKFPYNKNNCRFLGSPIDYVIFEQDKIIIMEVKTSKSQLSSKQENIKRLVQDNKVYWEEIRI